VALAASYRAWRNLYRQRERAFASAMADRQEWEHAAAISGAWPLSATPDRVAASPAKGSTDQERSSLTSQTVRATAEPEDTPCDRCQRVICRVCHFRGPSHSVHAPGVRGHRDAEMSL
jgi:hypothetical protein